MITGGNKIILKLRVVFENSQFKAIERTVEATKKCIISLKMVHKIMIVCKKITISRGKLLR